MNIKIEVHKNHFLERKLKKLDDWKVPASTIKEVKTFIEKARIGQVNEGKKLSDRTISKYLTLLKQSLEHFDKPTSKLTKKDVENYDKFLTAQKLKSSSDYKTILKVFLGWKLGKSKTDKIAGWLDTRTKKKTPDYLSEKEIELLYKNCKSHEERFLIAVLFDTGARIEEFLNIRFEDVTLPEGNQTFIKIALKEEYSKTKGRTISLYWNRSLEAVTDYINHRKKEGVKLNDPVFNKNYDAVRMFLNRLGKKILNKKVYCHLFRHSSATYYSTRLNRQELCYRYGWAFSSDMPDIYISRAGMENKELDEKFERTELNELKIKLAQEEHERKKLSDQFENLLDMLGYKKIES